MTRDHDNRAASEESRLPVEPSIQGAVTGERVGDILRSIGEVAYEWDLQSDALSWGPNVREVLGIGPDIDIASGRLYAKLLDCGSTIGRYDAIIRSQARDEIVSSWIERSFDAYVVEPVVVEPIQFAHCRVVLHFTLQPMEDITKTELVADENQPL